MRQRDRTALWALAGLGLALAARTASADSLQFTGDVERDFPLAEGNGVVAIIDNPGADGIASTLDVAQHEGLPGVTGWNMKDVRLSYDADSDRMSFGVNFFGVAGDADGDGDPGSLSATGAMGGTMQSPPKDLPSLGGREAIVVAIDTDLDGTPDVVAGVPAFKSPDLARGTDAFTVAEYEKSPFGLAESFGETLSAHLGELAHDPSAAMPDFEFTVENFKGLPGLVPEDGFIVSAFAGTADDVIAGEDFLFSTRIAFPGAGQQQIPEPAAVVAWSLVVGAALAWRQRRGRRRG